MRNVQLRIGNFTSSNIHKLLKTDRSGKGFGAPALTYIKEKNYERRLGRSIDTDAYSQPMAWGKFMELFAFSNIGMEYQIKAKTTLQHPKYDFWAGSSDLIVEGKKISELKSYQLKKYCEYTDALMRKDLQFFKENFEQEYWQIVSNACIHGVDYGEAISYIPYEDEMQEIRDAAENYDGADQWHYRFIAEKDNADLPCIKRDGYYTNVTKFEFLIPQEDKDLLERKVVEASIYLEKRYGTL